MTELGWGEGYECGRCRVDMEVVPWKSLNEPVKIRCPKCNQTAHVG
jgi:DNA-directed RNA polymerase subunit RPC12/RpoP